MCTCDVAQIMGEGHLKCVCVKMRLEKGVDALNLFKSMLDE